MKKRQRVNSFNIDLSDAPAQNPIPKNGGRIGRGASKYTGVSFDKHAKKWIAQIKIEGKQRRIGYYDNEEEAAVDYARAVFKYKGQEALDKVRKTNSFAFDMTDVPPQLPIPKSDRRIVDGASKYIGVSLDKRTNKWHARITVNCEILVVTIMKKKRQWITLVQCSNIEVKRQ